MQDVPFGNYTCLTYFAFLLAKLWEQAEVLRRQLATTDQSGAALQKAEVMMLHATMGCIFAEQVAVEGGARYQLGWLLTGLEEPPWNTTQSHRPRPGALPHGKLVEAQWVAAQLAFMKDLDVMQERLRKQGGGGGGGGGQPKKEEERR